MSGTQNLVSYLGWTFLPGLATRFLQSVWYRLTIRVGDPAPQPGSPKHTKHRRRILMGVIIVYLLYTIFEADWNIRRDGDFYQALGVTPDVNDRELKSRFRRLTIQFHPDKMQNVADRQAAESYFVHLRLAYDTLLDPVKRFAYDRFGPDMLEWKHCSSVGDYMSRGFQTLAPYYAAGGGFMVIMGVLGYFEWGRYWRYFFYGCLLTFEVYTVSRPYHPQLIANFINPILTRFTTHAPLLPFQQLILARKILITLFIAFSQLGALIQPPNQSLAANSEDRIRQQIDRLEHISKVTEVEATRLLALDMAPFAGDDQAIKDVKGRLQNWLVENTIRGDPEVRDAVGRVMTRRRPDAPAGARGTK